MNKKTSILLSALLVFSSNCFALVGFDIQNAKYVTNLMVEDNLSLVTDKNEDFVVLYNKKNEVIYYKHKNLPKTYKVALLKIDGVNSEILVKPEKSSLNLLGYKTQLVSFKLANNTCMQVQGSTDLADALNTSASSIYALYQGFVYMTGQMQMPGLCKTMALKPNLDSNIGFPLAVFFGSKQVKLENMLNQDINMAQFLIKHNIDLKKAVAPDLNLQYEILFSMLTKKQQDIFLKSTENKSLAIQIRAMDNLLKGF